VIIKDPTTPKTRRYTTLWNIGFQKLNWPWTANEQWNTSV